jgi:hypothetical protein
MVGEGRRGAGAFVEQQCGTTLHAIVRVGEELQIGALGSGDELTRTAVFDDPSSAQDDDSGGRRYRRPAMGDDN